MGPAGDYVAVALARTRFRTNPAGAKKSNAQEVRDPVNFSSRARMSALVSSFDNLLRLS
jgi:hypothetical protein